MSRGFSESIQPSDPRKLRTPPVGTCDGAVAPNIHLMIVSPVRLVREGLAANLQGRENIVAIDAVSLDPSGLARIAQSEPDVVLIDLGQADPAAVSRLVKEASPHTRLVAFALHEIDEDVFACAAAGYCGYVPREGVSTSYTVRSSTRLVAACIVHLTSPPPCSTALPICYASRNRCHRCRR